MGICQSGNTSNTDLNSINYEEELRSLYLITPIFNCARSKTTIKQYLKFKQYMERLGVKLITIECAYLNSPFAVTQPYYEPKNIQVRTNTPIFQKERLINIALEKLPADAKYVLWCDYDIEFLNDTWVSDAIYALNKQKMVQLFQYAIKLGPNQEEENSMLGFAAANSPDISNEQTEANEPKDQQLGKDGFYQSTEMSGYAWGFTIDVLKELNGLFDQSITGNSFTIMCYALHHRVEEYVPKELMPESFRDSCKNYQELAVKVLDKDIGFISGTIRIRYSHQIREKSAYENWDIYKRCDFDPRNDLVVEKDGCYKIHENKPELSAEMGDFFSALNGENIE